MCVCLCVCELRCFKQQIHFRFVINLCELHDPSEPTGNSLAAAETSAAQSESSSPRYSSALLCVRIMSESTWLPLENTMLQDFRFQSHLQKTSAKNISSQMFARHVWFYIICDKLKVKESKCFLKSIWFKIYQNGFSADTDTRSCKKKKKSRFVSSVHLRGKKVPFEWKQSYLKQHLNLLSFAEILFDCSPAFWESSSQVYAHFIPTQSV